MIPLFRFMLLLVMFAVAVDVAGAAVTATAEAAARTTTFECVWMDTARFCLLFLVYSACRYTVFVTATAVVEPGQVQHYI